MKKLILITIILIQMLAYSQFSGGTGTIEDPYHIATAEDLDNIRNYLEASFIQTADIDLGVPPWNENGGWVAIAEYDWTDPLKSFRGNYDGDGYKVENMVRDTLSDGWAGLFGSTDGCILENINLVNFDIEAIGGTIGGLTSMSCDDNIINCYAEGKIKGSSSIGLLVGRFNSYNIKNCHVKGEINSRGSSVGGMIGFCNADSIIDCSAEVIINSDDDFIGGLIGFYLDTAVIENCNTTSTITTTNGKWIGGFIGALSAFTTSGIISNCFSSGTITSSNSSYIGGFSGDLGNQEEITISNSYSRTDIAGDQNLGGFIYGIEEHTIIQNCYSTGQVTGNEDVGGFIGLIDSVNTVTVTNSYWDMETSGIDSSAAGEGRTTAEMTLPYSGNTYIDWDFTDIWNDDIYNYNDGYPRLQWASGIEENDELLVESCQLFQNYPNPFNPVTQIRFALPVESNVKLSVFNINGQLVSELVNEMKYSGTYTITFDGSNLTSGVYYTILSVDGIAKYARKMLMVK